MPTKPTFSAALRNGTQVETPYTPLIVTAGSTNRTLALHKRPDGIWSVSDPKSGAAVVGRLTMSYKGVPCSTRGATLRQAQVAAHEAVELLLQRLGAERFNAVLDNPKPF